MSDPVRRNNRRFRNAQQAQTALPAQTASPAASAPPAARPPNPLGHSAAAQHEPLGGWTSEQLNARVSAIAWLEGFMAQLDDFEGGRIAQLESYTPARDLFLQSKYADIAALWSQLKLRERAARQAQQSTLLARMANLTVGQPRQTTPLQSQRPLPIANTPRPLAAPAPAPAPVPAPAPAVLLSAAPAPPQPSTRAIQPSIAGNASQSATAPLPAQVQQSGVGAAVAAPKPGIGGSRHAAEDSEWRTVPARNPYALRDHAQGASSQQVQATPPSPPPRQTASSSRSEPAPSNSRRDKDPISDVRRGQSGSWEASEWRHAPTSRRPGGVPPWAPWDKPVPPGYKIERGAGAVRDEKYFNLNKSEGLGACMRMYSSGRNCEHADDPDSCYWNHGVRLDQLIWCIENRNVHPSVVNNMARWYNSKRGAGQPALAFLNSSVTPGLGPAPGAVVPSRSDASGSGLTQVSSTAPQPRIGAWTSDSSAAAPSCSDASGPGAATQAAFPSLDAQAPQQPANSTSKDKGKGKAKVSRDEDQHEQARISSDSPWYKAGPELAKGIKISSLQDIVDRPLPTTEGSTKVTSTVRGVVEVEETPSAPFSLEVMGAAEAKKLRIEAMLAKLRATNTE